MLNDSVLDLKIKLLMRDLSLSDPLKHSRIHVFNSMFYTKLCQDKRISDGYELVKRWTKNVNIFDKDILGLIVIR